MTKNLTNERNDMQAETYICLKCGRTTVPSEDITSLEIECFGSGAKPHEQTFMVPKRSALVKFSRDGDTYADEENGFWIYKEPEAPSHQWVLAVYAGEGRDCPCAYFPTMRDAREYAEAIVRTRYSFSQP